MRILLVEDTIDVGEAIVASLSRIGHVVEWITDGTRAPYAARSGLPGRAAMRVPRNSLYTRLVVRIGLVLVLGGAALLLAIWMAAQLAANEAYDRLLTGNALQIAENVWLQESSGEVNVDLPMAAFMLTPGVQTFYTVLDQNGRSIAGDSEFHPAIPWERLPEGPILFDGHYLGADVRIAVLGRKLALDHPRPWAVVAVAQTREGRSAFARDVSGNAVIVIVVMVLLTILAALFACIRACRRSSASSGKSPRATPTTWRRWTWMCRLKSIPWSAPSMASCTGWRSITR